METAVTEQPKTHVQSVPPLARKIDLADLVALLLALTKPDRDLDLIVDTMLGGDRPLAEVDAAKVRAGFWLRDQVPKYTEGAEALSALAHRRGYRIETYFDGHIWHVETRSITTGEKVAVKHPLRGVAGIAGIAAMTGKETAR